MYYRGLSYNEITSIEGVHSHSIEGVHAHSIKGVHSHSMRVYTHTLLRGYYPPKMGDMLISYSVSNLIKLRKFKNLI